MYGASPSNRRTASAKWFRARHAALVKRAGRWLRGTAKCSFVLEEPICPYISEEPDAIGWRDRESIVIECKISRSDFLRDKKKAAHQRGSRMGSHRFYMAPIGLLTAADIPPGWGLLEVKGNQVLQTVAPLTPNRPCFEHPDRDLQNELLLAISAARMGGERMFEYFKRQALERVATEVT